MLFGKIIVTIKIVTLVMVSVLTSWSENTYRQNSIVRTNLSPMGGNTKSGQERPRVKSMG